MSTQRALAIKHSIDNSVQMQYLRELSRVGEVTLRNFSPARFFACHSSTKSNLHVDKKAVKTEWHNTVDWRQLNRDVMIWCRENLAASVLQEQIEYHDSKIDLSLSPFDPTIHINQLIKYGINHGSWTDLVNREFRKHFAHYLEEITWTDEDIKEVSRDHVDWNELLLEQPMFSILRHSATSAYPDYTKQSQKFILEKYALALDSDPYNKITSYHRRHGYSRKIDPITRRVQIVEKDRWVGGDSFRNKIKGLPVTYSFMKSRPTFTPYYRPWRQVFDDLSYRLKNLGGDFCFTSDQSGFDQNHNTVLTRDSLHQMRDSMPDHMKSDFDKVINCDYNNPVIIMNARYYLRLGRWMSVSGCPYTPLVETINNLAAHRYTIDQLSGDLVYMLVQIDDAFVVVEKGIDLEDFATIMRKDLGLIMNPDKTETSIKGHIVYLQVDVGHVLSTDPVTITGMKWEDGFGYLGYVMRRIHRLRFRERMLQIAGDVTFYDDEGNDVTDKPVSRFLGTISSFGPMLPIDLFDIIWGHHERATYLDELGLRRSLLDEVIQFCKNKHVRVHVGEYGFDPRMVMTFVADNY